MEDIIHSATYAITRKYYTHAWITLDKHYKEHPKIADTYLNFLDMLVKDLKQENLKRIIDNKIKEVEHHIKKDISNVCKN